MKRRRSALVLIIGTLALLVNLSTASAHTQLLSADPIDGSVLSSPPTQVVLTFDEALLEEAVAIAISNSTGEVVSGTVASAAGAIVTIPWPTELAPDTYAVVYRIVSDDGHPVTGSIGLTYSAASGSPSVTSTAPVETSVVAPQPAGFPIGVVGLVLALAATITVIILARHGRK
ncbi:MAG: copper resistance protein CopC [Candidatus Nanopelagicales bacterium]|nr:copper resistance protein CopC [Candidatus Nanopelagicales bacterium]